MKKLTLISAYILLVVSAYTQDDWKKIKTEEGITVWTKDVKGSEVKQFKAKAKFDVKLSNIVAALRDVERMHLWYGRVKSVKVLDVLSDSEAIYLLEYMLPLPFKNRYSTLKGVMKFDPQKKLAKIETGYIDYSHKMKEKGPLITRIRSLWELEGHDDGTVSVTHEGFLDPGGNVPIWAINKDVVESPLKSLKALKQFLAQNYKP